MFGLYILLQLCNSFLPVLANLHCFPRPARAKKYNRNLNTAQRQAPFHYAKPSKDTEPEGNNNRQQDPELQPLRCDTAAVEISFAAFADKNQPRQQLSSIPSTPVLDVAPTANDEPLDTALQCATQTCCETEVRQDTLATNAFLLGE